MIVQELAMCVCVCVWFHYSNCNWFYPSEWRKEGVRINGIVRITTATATTITLIRKTIESNCRTISLYWYLSRFVFYFVLIFWKMWDAVFFCFLCISMYVGMYGSVACNSDWKWKIKEEASERAKCEFYAIIISWCGFLFYPSLNLLPSSAFY